MEEHRQKKTGKTTARERSAPPRAKPVIQPEKYHPDDPGRQNHTGSSPQSQFATSMARSRMVEASKPN
jgi:hypothetical protein